MSTLQVANVHLESTANNRIQYVAANSVAHVAGGITIFSLNSSSANVATNNFFLGTSSNTANGYTRLPNGLLMQWGSQTASVNTITNATATFSTSFTTLYSATINVQANNGVMLQLANATNIVWRANSTGAAASATMYYMAIGV